MRREQRVAAGRALVVLTPGVGLSVEDFYYSHYIPIATADEMRELYDGTPDQAFALTVREYSLVGPGDPGAFESARCRAVYQIKYHKRQEEWRATRKHREEYWYYDHPTQDHPPR